MKIWVIADTHFNHPAMVDKEGRPEDFTERIIANWRKVVASDDLVIHLGDVIFRNASTLSEIMTSLPGRKVLTLGDHDGNGPKWFMARGFDFACEEFIYDTMIFTHHPFHRIDGLRVNYHGHIHKARYDEFCAENAWYDPTWNINVQIEDTLAPIQLDTLIAQQGETP